MAQLPGSARYQRATDNSAIAISGFKELIYALDSIRDGAEKEARDRIRTVGERVALVAAGNAPRLKTHPSDSSGYPGELSHSVKTSVNLTSASIYSIAVYGGAINVGAWSGTKETPARGPHISRKRASHYMDRAVTQTAPWVAEEMDSLLDWVTRKFEEG